MTIDFKEEFKRYLEAQRRDWSHDRTLTVGASQSFACLRRTYFNKHKFSPDSDYEESFGATARGSSMENDYVVPALRSMTRPNTGYGTLLWAGQDQTTLISGRLSATPDGIITDAESNALSHYGILDIQTDCFMVQIKSFDPRVNLTQAKPIHVGQVHQQIGLVRQNTDYRPVYGIILYVNASFVDDVRIFTVKYDPDVYESAKRRAEQVYTANSPQQIIPQGKLLGGKDCKYCPYQIQCSIVQTGMVPTAKLSYFGVGKEDELTSLVDTYSKLKSQTKVLQDQFSSAQQSIKQWMRDNKSGVAKLGDGRTVVFTKSVGRMTLDKEAIARDTGIDLDKYMKQGKPFETLKILKG